jgi:hypothetical protein
MKSRSSFFAAVFGFRDDMAIYDTKDRHGWFSVDFYTDPNCVCSVMEFCEMGC